MRRPLAIALALFVAVPAAGERVLVDGVAAVVGRRVITRTEVDAEGRVVLVNKAGQKGLEQPLDDAFRKSVLEYLVVQELLVQEARRKHGIAVPESEVDKGVATFKARFSGDEEFRAFIDGVGADASRAGEETVRTIVRRDLTVAALLARVLVVDPPTGDEVRAWLAAHPGFSGGSTPEAAARAATEAIVRERREARFAAYVEELKASIDVRVVADFGSAQQG